LKVTRPTSFSISGIKFSLKSLGTFWTDLVLCSGFPNSLLIRTECLQTLHYTILSLYVAKIPGLSFSVVNWKELEKEENMVCFKVASVLAYLECNELSSTIAGTRRY
jgi:hypothetical protein